MNIFRFFNPLKNTEKKPSLIPDAIRIEDSHPELAAGLHKIIQGNSRIKSIHNGVFLDKNNRIIASAYKVDKIGRNQPCPCKSGKKYKKCCGRN